MGAQWIHGEEGNSIFRWAKTVCPEALEDNFDPGTGMTAFVDPQGNIMVKEVVDDFQNVATLLDHSDMKGETCSLGEFTEKK